MGAKTIMKRLVDRFNPSEDWDVETEVLDVSEGGTITNLTGSDLTAKSFLCGRCGVTSHFKNQKCARCDYRLI
jgi:ribosomal protein S27AE